MGIRKRAPWVVAAVLVLGFLYVWPGVWRYSYLERGTVRVDRLTGARQSWTTFLSKEPYGDIDVRPHWHSDETTCSACSKALKRASQQARKKVAEATKNYEVAIREYKLARARVVPLDEADAYYLNVLRARRSLKKAAVSAPEGRELAAASRALANDAKNEGTSEERAATVRRQLDDYTEEEHRATLRGLYKSVDQLMDDDLAALRASKGRHSPALRSFHMSPEQAADEMYGYGSLPASKGDPNGRHKTGKP